MADEIGKMTLSELVAQLSVLIDSKELATRKDMDALKKEMEDFKKENIRLRKEIEVLKNGMKEKDRKIEYVENYARRNNLIFKGLEQVKGTEKEAIAKFCKDVLKTDVEEHIEAAFTVGNAKGSSIIKIYRCGIDELYRYAV